MSNHFSETDESFQDSQFRKTAHYNVTHRRRQNFYALPTSQWQRLAGPPFKLLETLEQVDDAIDANAEIADAILSSALRSLGFDTEAESEPDHWEGTATPSDLDKARSTIRQMYRDWSEEGAEERRSSHQFTIAAIERVYAHVNDRSAIKVLVPGAGLGRLVFDLCMEGYSVEGNEISYHQLFASNWVLNHTEISKQYDLYPFALDFSNVVSREDQLKRVQIPDNHPGSALQVPRVESKIETLERMSMTAADFVTLYRDKAHKEAYDVVATIFFVDTAPNVIRYVEAINNCLKTHGIWINYGPLLWHFGNRGPPDHSSGHEQEDVSGAKRENTGIEEPGSVELSNEELIHLVKSMGFEMQEQGIQQGGQGYIQNPSSMLQNVYKVSYWVARKTQGYEHSSSVL